MKTKLLTTLAVAFLFVLSSFRNAEVTESYQADISKSEVAWLGKKVTGQHNGFIDLKSANLEIKNGKLVGGSFEIDMNTITNEDLKDETYNKKLVGHLKSDDFFGVEKYPTSKFVIKSVKHEGGDQYGIKGDISIKGKTESIEFPANVKVNDDELVAKAKIVIDRSKFDVRYGSSSFFDNLGDKMIYDEFELDITIIALN